MTERIRLSLKILLYFEGTLWFAHCLDLDIVAEGDTPEAALRSCVALCSSQIEYACARGDVESIFRAAPQKFWHMFALAQDRNFDEEVPESIERLEARELEFA